MAKMGMRMEMAFALNGVTSLISNKQLGDKWQFVEVED